MNQPVIDLRGLSKTYPGRKNRFALNDLTLSVERGEIFGYLGPNGAGKTTTIKLLLDLIRPDGGSATLLGLDSQAESVAIRRRVGYLPGDLHLWNNETGQAIIGYFARVRGTSDLRFARELSTRLDFDPSKKIRTYSTGNRRKLGLVLALMQRPELLILDEPTSGLDPLVQQTFLELMREAKRDGQTIFLSSHMLTEVQAVCDRAGILRDGHLLTTETIGQLTTTGFRWVTINLRESAQTSLVAAVPGVSEVTADERTLKLRLTGDLDPVLRALNDHYVLDMQIQEPTLEDIFLAYYGATGNGKAS